MPLTRPAEISDGVSLSDKLTRLVRAFVAEHGAVDALLPAVVDEFSPHENSVRCRGAEDDVFSGSDELTSLASISIPVG